jgi:hypothetical protein
LRKTQVKNVVRALANTNQLAPHDYQREYPGKRPVIVYSCYGWMKLPLPETVREAIRAYWPADHPRYWKPRTDEQLYAIQYIIITAKYGGSWVDGFGQKRDGRTLSEIGPIGKVGLLQPTDWGSGTNSDPRNNKQWIAAPLIPERYVSENRWNAVEMRWEPNEFRYNIEEDNLDARGLYYCENPGSRGMQPKDNYLTVTKVPRPAGYVEAQFAINSATSTFFVSGEAVANGSSREKHSESGIIFENDQFLFLGKRQDINVNMGEQEDVE